MRIWYDCEFLEDGRSIDLISIGMVAEDGRELYRIVDDEETITRAVAHDWLRENVVNHLPITLLADGPQAWDWNSEHDGWFDVWTREVVRDDVKGFIEATPEPELWAWYGAYDHVCYAQLFGRMIDLPGGFPMWTNDLKQEVVRRGNKLLLGRDADEHNALADAKWLRDAHLWLERESVDG